MYQISLLLRVRPICWCSTSSVFALSAGLLLFQSMQIKIVDSTSPARMLHCDSYSRQHFHSWIDGQMFFRFRKLISVIHTAVFNCRCHLHLHITSEDASKQKATDVALPKTEGKTEPELPKLDKKADRDPLYDDGLLLGRYLLCRSSGGELLGYCHPAYQHQFVLNRYLRVDQKGRTFLSIYDGHGNYSLI
ncbi:unnamed protein product [Calicophoron daubneyi]|uniref:Uncharacterized protein n=1 Tax=Calicophoron daubneyi TaxID=300641 RepID=A0AAV2TU90_CALDB